MAIESGPGPLCARAGFRDVTGDFEGAILYDCQDSEQLQHTDPADAVHAALDYMDADPETLEVTACQAGGGGRARPAERVLEDALERLDEALGDPSGEPCEPTPAMLEAARTFAAAIAADYTPWQCEPCGRATVDVATWRKADGIPGRSREHPGAPRPVWRLLPLPQPGDGTLREPHLRGLARVRAGPRDGRPGRPVAALPGEAARARVLREVGDLTDVSKYQPEEDDQ